MAEKESHLDWYFLSLAYLDSAELVLKKLVSKQTESYLAFNLAPVIYNFRHGLELFHKFLLKEIGEYEAVHDMSRLLQKVYPISATPEQLTEVQNHIDLPVDTKTLEKVYEDSQKEFRKIFSKYSKDDPNNTAFRYPDKQKLTKLKACTHGDLLELSEEIKKVRSFLGMFVAIHSDIFQRLAETQH